MKTIKYLVSSVLLCAIWFFEEQISADLVN
jgi:hypothetical protein